MRMSVSRMFIALRDTVRALRPAICPSVKRDCEMTIRTNARPMMPRIASEVRISTSVKARRRTERRIGMGVVALMF
jgi:hypothetical protein